MNNDPLAFTGTQPATSQQQSKTRVGEMLPDYDFSKARHEQISAEAVGAFLGGYDDIGAREEAQVNGDPVNDDGRKMTWDGVLAPGIATQDQAEELLRRQHIQEQNIAENAFPGYVRGADYEAEAASAHKISGEGISAEKLEELKRNAAEYGVEL